jgi:hypothetical protein
LKCRLGLLILLLLLLLLELLLILRGNRRHRMCSSRLEALLRLRLARKAGVLLLERLGRLRHTSGLTLHWESSILLLQRLLPEPRRLRRKGAGLLLLLATLSHVGVERTPAVLLAARALAVAAQKGVGVGIHCQKKVISSDSEALREAQTPEGLTMRAEQRFSFGGSVPPERGAPQWRGYDGAQSS